VGHPDSEYGEACGLSLTKQIGLSVVDDEAASEGKKENKGKKGEDLPHNCFNFGKKKEEKKKKKNRTRTCGLSIVPEVLGWIMVCFGSILVLLWFYFAFDVSKNIKKLTIFVQ